MKPMFLFGSGISPAPGVSALTDKILDGQMTLESAGLWTPTQTTSNQFTGDYAYEDPEEIRGLLRRLREHIRNVRRCKIADVTYEDIANICVQLDYNADTLRNPAIAPFADRLRSGSGMSKADFGHLVWNATDWIKWACFYSLIELPEGKNTDQIRRFEERILQSIGPTEIVTLNHDLHLDHILGAGTVAGFSNSSISTFHPDQLRRDGHRLIKLHGSIDWFSGARGEPIRKLRELDEEHIVSGPLVLSGTISKLEDYNYGPFPWLWAEFQNALRNTRRLVVCGYGFKDLGINSRLNDWLNHYADARMLVLHGEPDQLIAGCKSDRLAGICRFFDQVSTEPFETNGSQITIAPHWFAEASSNEASDNIILFTQT